MPNTTEGTHIANLLHRYAEYIDNGDLAAVAKLLRHCTIFGPEGQVLACGQQEVLKMYSSLIRIYPDTATPQTHHVVTNLILEEQQGDTLYSRANYSVMQKLKSGTIETIICGQYHNVFALVEQQWQFREHHMHPRIIGDMSEHLLIDLALDN